MRNTHLHQLLNEHDYFSRIISKTNEWLSRMLLLFYILILPTIDLGIIMIILDSTTALILGTIIIICIILIMIFNYTLSTIASHSHISYQNLNSVLCRKSLPLSLRLKVVALIEKLSGPVIGFYCYDLFPLTSYNIYLFYAQCASFFILFMSIHN